MHYVIEQGGEYVVTDAPQHAAPGCHFYRGTFDQCEDWVLERECSDDTRFMSFDPLESE